MTYEEKRELRLQISQLLADAGLNQQTVKNIVQEEIRHKVDRAVEQGLQRLDSQSKNGDFIKESVDRAFNSASMNYRINELIRAELQNRVINVTLQGVKDVT